MNFLDPLLPDRFWSKCIPEPMTGCWLWFGATNTAGYGQFAVTTENHVFTHRHAYSTLVGAIPAGLVLDHRCRVRCCCNPSHLEPVTHRENILRGVGPIVANANKAACPAGHTYDDANVRRDKHGHRSCRECQRQRQRRYYAEGRR